MTDYNLLLQQFEEKLLPHLEQEQAKILFSTYLKRIKQAFEIKAQEAIQQISENNISSKKTQNKPLFQQKNIVEGPTSSKEQLFVEVSHKLRTPLHGILGMSHLLERSPLNQEQQKYTAIIRSATDNLLLSMNELLNLSFDIQAPTNSQNLVKDKWVTNIPTSWRHKKILLIEDNEVNLIYAQNLFASGQVPLDIAKNLAIAAHKLNEQRYDCILSDVKLSDGNSFELITKLRGNNSAINQKTPIIVLTASANEKEANYAKTLNIQSYISKPFPPQLIISEMRKVLQEGSSSTVISSTKFQQSEAPVTLPPYFAHLEKNFKNKPKLQIEMFEIFLGQLPLAIEQMGKGLADNDLKVFHYDAHRIKSTINIIGLPKLKPLITKMDEYCYKKIHLDQLPKLYEQFKKQAAEDIKIISARKEALMVAS